MAGRIIYIRCFWKRNLVVVHAPLRVVKTSKENFDALTKAHRLALGLADATRSEDASPNLVGLMLTEQSQL